MKYVYFPYGSVFGPYWLQPLSMDESCLWHLYVDFCMIFQNIAGEGLTPPLGPSPRTNTKKAAVASLPGEVPRAAARAVARAAAKGC